MKLTSEEELKAKLIQLEDQLKEKDATIKAPWTRRVFAQNESLDLLEVEKENYGY